MPAAPSLTPSKTCLRSVSPDEGGTGERRGQCSSVFVFKSVCIPLETWKGPLNVSEGR